MVNQWSVLKLIYRPWHVYVRGKEIPSPAEIAERKAKIEHIGKQLEALTARAEVEAVEYTDFEGLLDQLHKLSFLPPNKLVSDVAHACAGEEMAARL